MKAHRKHRARSNIRRQKGLTVVEIIIWTVVSAIVTGALYAAFENWKKGDNIKTTNMIVDRLVNNAPSLRRSFGSFDGLDTTYVWGSTKLLDQTYKSATTGQIITPYSTDGLTVAPANSATMIDGTALTGTNMFWSITIKDVIDSHCQDTVEYWYPKALEVRVGTARVASPSAISTECNRVSGKTNVVVIVN
jgi:Tfp pilus assembly protein PilE